MKNIFKKIIILGVVIFSSAHFAFATDNWCYAVKNTDTAFCSSTEPLCNTDRTQTINQTIASGGMMKITKCVQVNQTPPISESAVSSLTPYVELITINTSPVVNADTG